MLSPDYTRIFHFLVETIPPQKFFPSPNILRNNNVSPPPKIIPLLCIRHMRAPLFLFQSIPLHFRQLLSDFRNLD